MADAYTPEWSDKFCALVAGGKSVSSICKQPDMPSKQTIFTWLRVHPDFLKAYQIATEERAEGYADEIIDIADDSVNDFVSDGEGGTRVDLEHIARARLRVDSRKWICGKMKPKKYGDKVETTHEAGDSLAALLQAIDGKSRSLPG
jgi:hypothetical protein